MMDTLAGTLRKATNTSGLVPLGHAVLVKTYEMKSESGIVIPDQVQRSAVLAEHRGIVVAIGAECWKEERERRCHIGDHVLFTKYAGFEAIGPEDKQRYRVINDRDIFIRIANPDFGVENG